MSTAVLDPSKSSAARRLAKTADGRELLTKARRAIESASKRAASYREQVKEVPAMVIGASGAGAFAAGAVDVALSGRGMGTVFGVPVSAVAGVALAAYGATEDDPTIAAFGAGMVGPSLYGYGAQVGAMTLTPQESGAE